MRVSRFILWFNAWFFAASVLAASPLPREEISALIMPPFSLGEPVNSKGVYTLLNSGGAEAGYAFETEPLAPCRGFPARRSTCWCSWTWTAPFWMSG